MSTEARIKVGQQVKVIQKSNEYFGQVGKMVEDDGDGESDYPYRVRFSDGEDDTYCRDHLEVCPKTLHNLEEGDVIVDERGKESKILGVCGRVIFIDFHGHGMSDYVYTAEYLENSDFKVKGQDEEVVERSVEDLEKELHLTPGTLRIRKEAA